MAELSQRRSAAPAITEKQFLQLVRDLATLTGWVAYHTHDSRRSDAGFPDLVLVRTGEPVIFAELKTDTGRLTKAQTVWALLLANCPGCEHYVWRPRDWDIVQQRLQKGR